MKVTNWLTGNVNLVIVFLQHCDKDSHFSEIRPNTTVWSLIDVSNQRKRLIFKVRNVHQSPLHGEATSDLKRKKKCSYYFVERKAIKRGINKRGKERFTTCKKKSHIYYTYKQGKEYNSLYLSHEGVYVA
jgi:hypothetical protein